MKQIFSEFMIQAGMIALQRHMSKQDLTSLELKSQIMWILSFLCVVVSVWFAYSKSKIYIYAVWAYLCLSDNFTSSKKLSQKSLKIFSKNPWRGVGEYCYYLCHRPHWKDFLTSSNFFWLVSHVSQFNKEL